ncbi:hypothetical protein V1523DRAFT_428979 [Lipomyces doorenjongii]
MSRLTLLPAAPHTARTSGVHPGLVQRDSGNKSAKAMGLQQAPHTKRQSIDAIIGLGSPIRP